MNIGIIVASKEEFEPFTEVFGQPAVHFTGRYDIYVWQIGLGSTLYLIQSGVGEIASASSTQYLIDQFHVDLVINYGVAGGLSESHQAGRIGVVEKIVHSDFDISLSGNHVVGEYPGQFGPFIFPIRSAVENITPLKDLDRFVCASADKFVGAGEPKMKLRREFGADICEMEAAGIVITCNRNNTPSVFIKAISDGADEDSEAYENNIHSASRSCVDLIALLIRFLYL